MVDYFFDGKIATTIGDFELLNYDKNYRYVEGISMIMQLGLTMSGSILFCFFIGRWLDKHLGNSGFFTFLFTLFGVGGGSNVCYRQIVSSIDLKRN